MTLVFIAPLEETGSPPMPATALRDARRSSRYRGARSAQAPLEAAAPSEAPAATPIDWFGAGHEAAARLSEPSPLRRFDNPIRPPPSREQKPFGWDETHTERVQALTGGGIGIHLTDNCDLIIAPFPIAGCAFGKRKARGDLFDEMKAPPEMGAWKDR